MPVTQLDDRALLEQLCEPEWSDRLGEMERDVFAGWLASSRPLTPKMLDWLRGAAERVGLQVAPAENLFSRLSPARQAEQLRAAAKVKLPWER